MLFLLLLVLSCDPGAERPGDATRQREETLVLAGATIYPSPTEAPLAGSVVVVRAGKIVEVGPRDEVGIPAGATVVDCDGMHLFAGFQNSHVHFTEPKWEGAADLPAEQLSAQLEEMLLRWVVFASDDRPP